MSGYYYKVLWIKVWGIAAIQGAITLTWVIYSLYFPLFLVQLGLSKELAIALLIVENALESIIEPIFGGLSDRHQQLFGSKIPLISIGIILSSALFFAIPSVVFLGNGQLVGQWIVPCLAVIWAGAMAIFRSPTMALLGRCATTSELPQAASILTLVGGIIGSLRFDSYGIILKLGAGFAFALGSFSLLIAGAILRILHPPEVPQVTTRKSEKVSFLTLSLIFATGISVSWGLRFLMPTVSNILMLQFGNAYSKLAMMLFLIILGLAALPAGRIATKLGNSLAMQIGALFTVVTLPILVFVPHIIIKLVAISVLIIAVSLVLNGVFPFVLSLFPPSHSGLGVGIYFGGFGAGMSGFDLVFSKLGIINIEMRIIGSTISFLLVLCWLVLSERSQRS